MLRSQNCRGIIIAGINSHACVRMTAIDAYQRDQEVILARDCIDSHDEEHHALSMRYLDGKIGASMTARDIQAVLRKHA